MEIVDQLTNVRKMAVAAVAESSRKGRVLAIMSGKGGVGKTNLVLNLAIALAKMEKSVTLFDGDTHLADMDILLGNVSHDHLG